MQVSSPDDNANLKRRIDELTEELGEALKQQMATAEILGVISNSPSDAQPVFDSIAQSAAQLCRARFCHVFRFDGSLIHFAAHHGLDPDGRAAIEREYPVPPGRVSAAARSILSGSVEEIPDLEQDPEYRHTAGAKVIGYRSIVAVPMLSGDRPIGAIAVARSEVGPFPSRQIALLQTFANQAVIAVENARLFEEVKSRTRELTEALEYQTATSEVLNVISRSPNELQPVLDTIVATAKRLCSAELANLWRLHNGRFELAAHAETNAGRVYFLQQNPIPVGRGSLAGRSVLERRALHMADIAADPDLGRQQQVITGNLHTMAVVPLIQRGEPIGVISLARTEVRPFTDKQIDLVTTFADQAVIAISNVGLFEEVLARTKELQESLAHQMATTEVLNVISRSPSEVQPVLDAIVETAHSLCQAEYALVLELGEDGCYHLAASKNADATFLDWLRSHPVTKGDGSAVGMVAVEKSTIHLPDALADPRFTDLHRQRQSRARTMLAVPLMRADEVIGAIFLARTEVRPFSDKQIELITTFADQAVIAINNARLFEDVQARTRELTEALEFQTASSEVLGVISSAPGKVGPVFDTILESARRLCGAEYGHLLLYDGATWRPAALHNLPKAYADFWTSAPVVAGPETLLGRILATGRPYQVPDALVGDGYRARTPLAIATVEWGGARTLFGVPLLKDGKVIGAIVLYRKVVRAFNDKQIALLSSFADQAVIAIENTRLFEAEQTRTKELQQSLEYQTATSEVLGVISSSPNDLQPVLDAIITTAGRLCEADYAHCRLERGGLYHVMAKHALDPNQIKEIPNRPVAADRTSLTGRTISERGTVHVPDVLADPEDTYAASVGNPARTMLGVPLMRNGVAIGAIGLFRRAVKPFTQRQIALVTTFADQAVIAINNARLFEELQARTRELAQSLEELRSLGEVGRTVSSTLDISQVLKTVLEHACTMAQASGGTIYVFDKARGEFHLEAGHKMSEEHIARVRAQPIRLGDAVVGECGERREATQVADLDKELPSPLLDILRRTGVRAVLAVPLLHQADLIGALVIRRNQPGAFSPEMVRLVEAFAAQSAIAIQNARLFREIEEKGHQLEIASRHKSQFVANMSHELRTPLAAILGYAELLKDGIYGALPEKTTPIIARVESNGKHLLGLINTVLDISKIEAGQFNLNLSEYAVSSMVETVRVATESLAAGKKLALKANVATDLPRGLGDEQRLTQVLLNLVGNAIKFTDAGEVRIMASAARGSFTLAVSDTGPGIPQEEHDKVFEKFHQIDNSNTRTKGGTGLGLAIAKDIVEMHGGRIWVESTVGRGATFRMEIPIRATTDKGAA